MSRVIRAYAKMNSPRAILIAVASAALVLLFSASPACAQTAPAASAKPSAANPGPVGGKPITLQGQKYEDDLIQSEIKEHQERVEVENRIRDREAADHAKMIAAASQPQTSPVVPGAASAKPPVTPAAPSAAPAKPAVATAAPAAAPAKPAVTTAAPAVAPAKPVVASTAPVVTPAKPTVARADPPVVVAVAPKPTPEQVTDYEKCVQDLEVSEHAKRVAAAPVAAPVAPAKPPVVVITPKPQVAPAPLQSASQPPAAPVAPPAPPAKPAVVVAAPVAAPAKPPVTTVAPPVAPAKPPVVVAVAPKPTPEQVAEYEKSVQDLEVAEHAKRVPPAPKPQAAPVAQPVAPAKPPTTTVVTPKPPADQVAARENAIISAEQQEHDRLDALRKAAERSRRAATYNFGM